MGIYILHFSISNIQSQKLIFIIFFLIDQSLNKMHCVLMASDTGIIDKCLVCNNTHLISLANASVFKEIDMNSGISLILGASKILEGIGKKGTKRGIYWTKRLLIFLAAYAEVMCLSSVYFFFFKDFYFRFLIKIGN